MNTPPGFTFAAGSAGARELRAGKTVMLYGNQGDVYVDGTGENISDGQGGLPYCGARILSSGELEVDWRFCTDQGKRGCANNSPGTEWTGTPENPLTSAQKLQIANVLLNTTLHTKRDRAKTQLQVWCISDDWAEGAVNTEAKKYFNYNDFQGPATSNNLEYRALSDDEARCAYLPDLTANPTLTLNGPGAQLSAGSPAQFTLTTNVTSPITITTTGASSIQLCPASQNQVTFNGTVLELDAPGTATLCAYSSTTAAVTVTAATGELPQPGELSLLWNGDRGCQVFADYIEGNKVQISRTASANFLGAGSFRVHKEFSGVVPAAGDLDDLSIELAYAVTGGPTLPAGTPSSGKLILNRANDFAATGPTYPDGTTLRISETAVAGLPPALQHDGLAWSVDGQPAAGSEVNVTIGDGTTVGVTLTNMLSTVLGTFEVRKSFAFDNGSTVPPPGTEVEVRWWVRGSDPSTAETLTLTETNGFVAMPGSDPASPTLFPIGTTILLEEVPQALPPGIANVIDWGSNTDPSYQGPENRGMVTIADQWDPAAHSPGSETSASEVTLTNGIAIDRGSLIVRKQVLDPSGGADQPVIGDGPFDDMEIRVTVSCEHPDPLISASGRNVLLLNAGNNWSAGLGVELPEGTVVTTEETAIYSVDPSIEWDQDPLWSCANCTPPFADVPGNSHSVTITGAAAGQPIDDLAIGLTNVYRVMTGSFSVEKIVAGDIARDDDRLDGIEFGAEWQSTDPANPGGSLTLAAPDWKAIPLDGAGDPVSFPLGTEITLSEIAPPTIPGVEWGDEVAWSIGDDGGTASFTIMDEDASGEAAANVTLTNFAELHEGTFSIAKFVHSIAPADTDSATFEVTYRSPGEDPLYAGTLSVSNDEQVISEAFPTGTELLLEEILPTSLPGTQGWAAPQFVDGDGNQLEAPVLITIGDGTDVSIDLINTTIEPEKPGWNPPKPPKPTQPTDPTQPTQPVNPDQPPLPHTGADPSVLLFMSAGGLVLLGVMVTLAAAARRRGSSSDV